MSLLAKATSGVKARPQINVFMGPPKIGKTTIACAFPETIIADLENRSFHIPNVRRLTREELPSLLEFKALIQELLTTEHSYKALTIDSAEELENMIHRHLCQAQGWSSIEEPGYGKGYTMSREEMTSVMKSLQQLRDIKNMAVNIVAHTQIKSINDPATNSSYDRYIMRVNDKLGAAIRDLSDNIFFCTYKYHVTTDKQTKKTKASGDGERVMYTQWRPAFDIGNTLGLPFELPLSYQALKEAMDNLKPTSPGELREEIKLRLADIKDEAIRTKAAERLDAAGDSIEDLNAIKARVIELTK